MHKTDLLSIAISTGTYQDFVSGILEMAASSLSDYVCVANVHMTVEAHQNAAFSSIIKNAAIVTPDGKPLTWALRFLKGIRQERVAGMDLLPDLLESAAARGLTVFFYGGTPETLEKTSQVLAQRYPKLSIGGTYSPPFRKLSAAEEEDDISRINQSGARLVFVVLGCPKQEKWMASMKGRVNAVMIGVGGALPVLVGDQKRAPVWMQKAGMEWLYRLAQEPRRLFKRYLITNSIFLFMFFRAAFQQKK